MEETKNTQAIEKPTYEELNDYCNQLMIQNKNLAQRLNQVMDAQNSLPYLFDIAKNPDIFGEDIAAISINRIKTMLFPAPKTENKETSTANTEIKED